MTRLAVLGAGGHAADVLSVVEAVLPPATSVVLGDDGAGRSHVLRSERLVAMSIERALSLADEFVVAVGSPALRRVIAARAIGNGCEAARPLVHPLAERHETVEVGSGVVVLGLTWISPHVSLSEHSYVGYGVKLGHHSRVGAFASVMPGAFVGGDSIVGAQAFVGANATVLQGVRVGVGASVGAGAVVTRSIPDGRTAVGVPAKLVDAHDS